MAIVYGQKIIEYLNLGFSCSVYKMTLVTPKVYVMVEVRRCFLPRCSKDFHILVNTLPSFLQLRDLVYEEVQSIAVNKGNVSDTYSWLDCPTSYRYRAATTSPPRFFAAL